eukprot:CAMPEP_0201591772 /NCGR_PEP_ID=MMETSP0190_2-20130828/189848_1 /ASSEMBLY_ACC=CAM_ASM_000263 /TAXON_ID=37353 /ORGANISM="Rosalina sp." /LENGTH=580 /DNA_ID=CAMNT_0048050237 /DNA_START=197 /DNA_END=1940 /DNA_ORIENTATION=-
MVSYDSKANQLAKQKGLDINYVSWEDCARYKNSSWGPCISDMTLRVNESCMPVIRQPNFTDKTWDVPMDQIPIVIGNHTENKEEELQTISLKDYITNFSDFMTNDHYKQNNISIDLTSSKESKDSHVIMSSQACFLPIQSGQETKFNVALYNYQSHKGNPALLTIVSTAKGSSAQIIEGTEQHLLFNNNGKKADFIGERVSDHRKKKGQKDIHNKKLSKQEKQDNVIVIVQIPLKQKIPEVSIQPIFYGGGGMGDMYLMGGGGMDMLECEDMMIQIPLKQKIPEVSIQPIFYGGGGIGDMYLMNGGGMGGGMDMLECEDMMMPQMNSMIQQQHRSKSMSNEKANVEAAIVRVAERTKPQCICGKELCKYQLQYTYNNGSYSGTISCDGCGTNISEKTAMIYHCPDGKNNYKHKNGYDLCLNCGEKQLKFDELRGMLDNDKSYKLERDERYPIRCTLQYYKATDNGVVNKEIMDDLAKQLEQSQKQADFMGSLVTEYNPNRPNEWVNNDDNKDPNEGDDDMKEIKKALEELCGNDWKTYLTNFEKEEVKDGDLENIGDDDLKELIPKMGPRNRFKKWMQQR